MTPRFKKVIGLGLREAIRLGDKHIGTEHLLLGLLRDGAGQGVTALKAAGLTVEDVCTATVAAMGRTVS